MEKRRGQRAVTFLVLSKLRRTQGKRRIRNKLGKGGGRKKGRRHMHVWF